MVMGVGPAMDGGTGCPVVRVLGVSLVISLKLRVAYHIKPPRG